MKNLKGMQKNEGHEGGRAENWRDRLRGEPFSDLYPCQYAALDLIAFDGFKQGFEISFAETVVSLALNNFKEHRTEHGFGENLQKQPLVTVCRAVEQDTARMQCVDRLAVLGQALFQHVVIHLRGRRQEIDAG